MQPKLIEREAFKQDSNLAYFIQKEDRVGASYYICFDFVARLLKRPVDQLPENILVQLSDTEVAGWLKVKTDGDFYWDEEAEECHEWSETFHTMGDDLTELNGGVDMSIWVNIEPL